MKFDYDQAWKDTTALLGANLGLLAVIAGVFFFLPYAALMIALPDMAAFAQPEAAAGADIDAMMGAMMDFYRQYWWALVAMAAIQGIGLLAMLALMRNRASPTVGEALATGARSVLSYIAAQLLQSAVVVAIAAVLIGLGALAGSVALTVLLGLVALVIGLYVFTKLSLVAPVIAIDGELNPVAAMRRSWALTKGNSVRLFFFYVLIFVALAVVSGLLQAVLGLGLALGGEEVALFGTAMVSALMTAAMMVLMACLFAAIHRQMVRLAAPRAPVEDTAA